MTHPDTSHDSVCVETVEVGGRGVHVIKSFCCFALSVHSEEVEAELCCVSHEAPFCEPQGLRDRVYCVHLSGGDTPLSE